MYSYPAICLCQALFLLIYTLLLLPCAQATTVQRLNNSGKAEAASEIKKASKPLSVASTAQAVANPKLKLSTRISSMQLAEVSSVSHTKTPNTSTNTINLAQTTQPVVDVLPAGASGAISGNNTGLQYQTKKIEVERELEHENRMLLGLTLIFVTGLLITYFISRYRPLL